MTTFFIEETSKGVILAKFILIYIAIAAGYIIAFISFAWDTGNSPNTAVILNVGGLAIVATSSIAFPLDYPGVETPKKLRGWRSQHWTHCWGAAWATFGFLWRFRSDDWQALVVGQIAEIALWIIYMTLLVMAVKEFILQTIRRRVESRMEQMQVVVTTVV